jgi:signal transduction histidine kinase
MISLPVVEDNKVRMIVGVGNKPEDYEAIDVETLQLMANEAWRIVEHRRSEQALKLSEELLDETGQAAGVGGWEVNLLTNELRWTKQTYRIHELPLDYRPSVEKALDFYDPEEREVLIQAIEEAKRTGKPYHLELRFTTSTGRRLWVRTIGQARFEHGRAVKLLGAFQDITERKNAEQERLKLGEQLAQAQKMESVGLLAGGIAHEFNNKLQAILGFTEMATLQADAASPLMPELMEIQRAAQQSAELTRQLLAYASKQLVAPQRIHLGRTIKGMLRMIGQVLGENIDVTYFMEPDLVPVRIDPNQVDQILTNLVLNARDAMQGRGRLAIHVSNSVFALGDPRLPLEVPPGEFACLSVRDEGTGIPAEIIDQIFEPFFTTKPQGKGTGLGLPTVYGIARQNGGFVEVESEVGQGTTMRVFLPRDRVAETTREQEAPLPRSVGGPEVLLVVDDEPAVLKMMVRGLSGLGYQVHAAGCAEDAVRQAKAFDGSLRLLLTDVMMPGESGVELYRKLRKEHPGLKVLYISGHADEVLGPQGVIDSGQPFVAKPFTIRTLNDRIRSLLDQSN